MKRTVQIPEDRITRHSNVGSRVLPAHEAVMSIPVYISAWEELQIAGFGSTPAEATANLNTAATLVLNDLERHAEPPFGDDARGKRCPACSAPMVAFSSIQHPDFAKPGYRECVGCGAVHPWHLEDGQMPLLGSNRQGRVQ